jgi:hypothetical protein
MTTQPKIQSNGEDFTTRTYMGVSILVRDKDGYVNASKMGNGDDGRRARDFINPDPRYRKSKFAEICDKWSSRMVSKPAKYKLDKGFDNDVKGTYIHPDLVHFVAEWIDLDYAWVVVRIVKEINKQLHSIMEDNDLPDEPVVAKKLLDSATLVLKVKDAEIEELKEDYEKLESDFYDLALENVKNEQGKKKVERRVERLEQRQFDRDVRTDYCSRRIKILKDEEKCYHLSCDDKRNYQGLELVSEYVFVSGINIRLDARTWMASQFNRKIDTVPKFSESELPTVVTYIESLNPKEITIYV